jgi:hypothetical protein
MEERDEIRQNIRGDLSRRFGNRIGRLGVVQLVIEEAIGQGLSYLSDNQFLKLLGQQEIDIEEMERNAGEGFNRTGESGYWSGLGMARRWKGEVKDIKEIVTRQNR